MRKKGVGEAISEVEFIRVKGGWAARRPGQTARLAEGKTKRQMQARLGEIEAIQAWLREVAVVSLQVDPDRVLELEKVGIAAGTEAGLQAAVRSLLEDPQARLAYAERGCRHALTRHSLANARELVRLIDQARSAATENPR